MMKIPELWMKYCGNINSTLHPRTSGNNCTSISPLRSLLFLDKFSFSSCIVDASITAIVVCFLLLFWFNLIVKWRSQTNFLKNIRNQRYFYIFLSIITVFLGAINLVLGLWFFDKSWKSDFGEASHQWILLLIRGLGWFSLGYTLTLRLKYSSERALLRAWWSVTFLLSTIECAFGVLGLIENGAISVVVILSFVSWPVSVLILFCALKKGLSSVDASFLSEPLLNGSFNNEGRVFRDGSSQKVSNAQVTPFSDAGFLSRMTFWWLNPLLAKGRRHTLEQDDLPKVSVEDQAQTNYLAFSKQMFRMNNENPATATSVFSALYQNEKKRLAVTGFYAFLKTCAVSCGPIVLQAFIRFSEQESYSKLEGFVLAASFFILKVVESLAQRQWYFGTRRIGLQIRSALIAAIYQKQLKLSNQARQEHTAGEINNYVAVDAYRIGEFPFWAHMTWTTILQLIFALVVLYFAIGWATLSALAVVILTVLCNSPLAKLQHKFQSELMVAQDQRLRATTETLSHMKVLKLHAWERQFKEHIENLRQVEYKWLSAVQYRKAYTTVLFWASPVLVSSVTFATCYLVKIPLTASNVFTFIATLRLVQEPIRLIPDVIAIIIQAKVSLDRIENFLKAPELQQDAVQHLPFQVHGTSILIRSATLSWDTNSLHPTLRDINLEVKRGEKVAICGEVGSGKSTMLAAILGEVPKLKGEVQVYGSIAFVSQTAWIQSGTIRENILFGRSFHRGKYEDVIIKCSLAKDFQNFPFGDQTEIGERGVNLSGGQKQRIQLARALYQDADIYLLDDPFSAVDADTASSLFMDYMMGALSEKTVILVTHLVDFLPAFDNILLMLDGQISQLGKFQDLLDSSKEFSELVNAHKGGSTTITSSSKNEPIKKDGEIERTKSKRQHWTSNNALKGDQLIKEEEKEVGNPGLRPYILYLKQNKGFLYFTLATLAQMIFVSGQLSQNTWMASKVQDSHVSTLELITVYSAIGFAGAIFLLFRGIFVVCMGMKASKSFFSELLTSFVRAPMAFFDATPLGRILSRVSLDLNILDIDLPFSLIFTVAPTLNTCATVGVIAVVTWQVLFLVVPMIYLVIQLQKYYFSSAKELMRINGTTKSPISNHLGESVSGAMTIRAFKVEDQFFRKNLDLTDKNASPFFHTFSANEWLIQRLEVLSATLLSCSALTMVLLPKGNFRPGFIGMALSYGLSMNMSLVFSIQNQCTLSNHVVSVERIKQYMNIPSEAPEVVETNRPSVDWPSQGKVEFDDLKVRYRANSPLVLHGITCVFEPSHKIGVVGRTGSGKTTLISAIFRLVEPAGGKIIIDGLNTTTIGLHDLRSRLGIIPQEPTLFRGTVRFNLDPLSEFSDMAIWEALHKCQLEDVVKEKDYGLDSLVGDDGENWSVGQRQLFCLGRALLRRSKILVLDEATASIDNATDAVIQATIRTEFKESTVITVAHRIPTVMDSDMVLAISDGKMVEYDKPSKLMENKESLFGRLVLEYWSHTSNALIHSTSNT